MAAALIFTTLAWRLVLGFLHGVWIAARRAGGHRLSGFAGAQTGAAATLDEGPARAEKVGLHPEG